jgi:tetratricopeptide (TPR) repeat protein
MRLSAYRDALSASERALAVIASSEDANPAMRARLLLTIGMAQLWLTDHATATARLEECIALARTIGDRALESKALARLGRIGLEQGKFDQAERDLQNGLRIARELNDANVMAYTLALLGYISHYEGRYADAQNHGEESYKFAKQSGDAIAQSFSLNMLAMVSVNNHQFQQAHDYHLQAIEICKNAGDRYGFARTYNNLSVLIRVQRKYAQAKPYTMEGIKLARELGNRYTLPIMLINLVYSQVGLGELDEAYTSLREALQLNIENDSISWVIFSLVGYANILAAEGKRQSALQILGLCRHHPETNSDTQRDIQLILEDLGKVRSDDIETELEAGRSLELNKTVLMALGG